MTRIAINERHAGLRTEAIRAQRAAVGMTIAPTTLLNLLDQIDRLQARIDALLPAPLPGFGPEVADPGKRAGYGEGR